MTFHFIIPDEIENQKAVVYECKYLDNEIVRIYFPMGDQFTTTDYPSSEVAKKFNAKVWLPI